MKKSEIFKKAHRIAKSNVSKVKNYSIALSFALKEVYASLVSFESVIEKMGFKLEEYGYYAGYYYLGKINVKRHPMMERFEVDGKMFDYSEQKQAIEYIKGLI